MSVRIFFFITFNLFFFFFSSLPEFLLLSGDWPHSSPLVLAVGTTFLEKNVFLKMVETQTEHCTLHL